MTYEGAGLGLPCQDEEASFFTRVKWANCAKSAKSDFMPKKPNQKWVTDVTEFSLFGEKLYLPRFSIC